MEALAMLGNAFVSVCTPASLAMMVAGVAIGIVFGSIPGLSASMAVALMLPLTFSMTPSMGLNTLVAVYIGGISGGLISAILLNMPGTASSIATTFDGYPMAQNGEAMKALGLGIVFSFLGSVFSFIILTFLSGHRPEVHAGGELRYLLLRPDHGGHPFFRKYAPWYPGRYAGTDVRPDRHGSYRRYCKIYLWKQQPDGWF